jgi:hypothetical protein
MNPFGQLILNLLYPAAVFFKLLLQVGNNLRIFGGNIEFFRGIVFKVIEQL